MEDTINEILDLEELLFTNIQKIFPRNGITMKIDRKKISSKEYRY